MKRVGVVLWALSWGFLYYRGLNRFPLPVSVWMAFAAISFLAAFGRVAEWFYFGGAPFPFLFPAHAQEITLGIVGSATGFQITATMLAVSTRWNRSYRERAQQESDWADETDEVPLYSRSGNPLNGAAWRAQTPETFEEEVLELFRRHGFEGRLTAASGDEGIDLELERDGEFRVVQCKHYRKPVGQPALRDFAGAMRAVGAEIGYFVTTSTFTPPAILWVESLEDPLILLVDSHALVQWSWEGVMPE